MKLLDDKYFLKMSHLLAIFTPFSVYDILDEIRISIIWKAMNKSSKQ